MKIHEFQAKALFRKAGIPVPEGEVAESPEQARAIAERYGSVVAVKAQVHAGGRGKAGGVKIAKTADEAEAHARAILGMDIKGSTVGKVLVERGSDIRREAYAAFTLDRGGKALLLIASAAGGIDIEEVAATTPEKILKRTSTTGTFSETELRPVAEALFDGEGADQVLDILTRLAGLYRDIDASLAEINPLVLTGDGSVTALDGKINLDDNALFRHPDLEAMRDLAEEVPQEIQARDKGLSFVALDGDIGCMVNGAGLAMATMDMIQIYGGKPANFLDVGGSSNPEKVVAAFEIILSNPSVKAVLINIFGGITRCDDIARGILASFERIRIEVPVVVRLTGTNAEEGLALLKDSSLIPAASFAEAVIKVIEASGGTVREEVRA